MLVDGFPTMFTHCFVIPVLHKLSPLIIYRLVLYIHAITHLSIVDLSIKQP